MSDSSRVSPIALMSRAVSLSAHKTYGAFPIELSRRCRYFANPLCASSYMIRRSVLPEYGFRAILAEDFGMTHDVMAMGHDIWLIREALVDYRISAGGIMASKLDRVALGALSVQRRALAKLGIDESTYDEGLAREIHVFRRYSGRDADG